MYFPSAAVKLIFLFMVFFFAALCVINGIISPNYMYLSYHVPGTLYIVFLGMHYVIKNVLFMRGKLRSFFVRLHIKIYVEKDN